MRSIAILNQKGGVGKTTTAVNLAAAITRRGSRVMLIDLDPQSHATLHVGLEVGPAQPNVYDMLVRGAPLAEVACDVDERLTVLPSSVDLVGAELELADREERDRALANAMVAYREGFDFCLIDCAPSLGLLTINALAAASEVIIPLQPHFLALQGLGRLLETVTLVRRSVNSSLRVSGVVLCMFEKGTRLAMEVRDDVTTFFAEAAPDAAWFGARVYATVIRRNIKLAECPSYGKTVFAYAANSHGAEDYAALADEVMRQGRLCDGRAADKTAALAAGALGDLDRAVSERAAIEPDGRIRLGEDAAPRNDHSDDAIWAPQTGTHGA